MSKNQRPHISSTKKLNLGPDLNHTFSRPPAVLRYLAGTKLSANLQSPNVREQTPSTLGFKSSRRLTGLETYRSSRGRQHPVETFLRKSQLAQVATV